MLFLRKKFLLLFCLIQFGQANSAGPITHAYLAERFLENFPRENFEAEKSFMIGTLYPDIRYISKVHRKETHIDANTLDDILEEPDPFIAGAKFHTYVDKERNIYVLASNVYPRLMPNAPINFRALLIKLIEDEYLLSKLDWKNYLSLLSKVHQGELSQGVPEATVKRWHTFLTLYFRSSPLSFLSLMSLLKNPVGPYSQKEALLVLPDFKKAMENPAFKDYVYGMVAIFENHIQTKKRQIKPLIAPNPEASAARCQ